MHVRGLLSSLQSQCFRDHPQVAPTTGAAEESLAGAEKETSALSATWSDDLGITQDLIGPSSIHWERTGLRDTKSPYK